MKQSSIFKLIIISIICAFAVASCTGPEGPIGPAGLDGLNGIDGINGTNGVDGKDGSDGKDGVDGNAMCLVCHTQAGMDEIGAQYASSRHGSPGFELGYAGPRRGCMECHSNEGYVAHAIGYDPSSNLEFASKITCGTCHGDHVSLEAGLSAPMRTDAAITAMADGVTVFDFEGSSNTCAACHQSRKNGSYYSDVDSVWNDDGTLDFVVHADSVYLSSSHASPHYTTMTNNIFAVGGYTNSEGHVMNAHKRTGCVGCHMSPAEDDMENGGHTMVATLNGCTTCHTSATDFDIDGTQTEVHAAEEAIAAALVEAGILNESHGAVVGVYHKDVFEAYWNYKIIHYDGSLGVHNPSYTRDLIAYANEKLGIQ